MVRLREINEYAIKTLSKVITFSSWKGILYAKKKPGKYTFPRSPRVQVMNRRWRICWGLIKNMDNTIRDAYKYWAQGTSYTWKDLAVREIMSIWHETGQTPLTLRHFDYTYAAGVITIHVQFNPVMTDEGRGYGLTGWGISPYGSPQEFLTEDGYLTPAIWHLAYGDPLPWPQIGFTY